MNFRTLKAEEIDVRVGQIGDGYFTLLMYKDARVDMEILDSTVGTENWQRKHYAVKDNMYCSVGIKCNGDWVWKDDCGTESNTEKEKGEASDSFKRACVNWGIGRELYSAPMIYVECDSCTKGGKDTPYKSYRVSEIGYTDKAISRIAIMGKSKKTKQEELIFSHGTGTKPTKTVAEKPTAPEVKTITKEQIDTLLTLKADMGGLCKYFKVDRVESMTYEQAEEAIRIKRGA